MATFWQPLSYAATHIHTHAHMYTHTQTHIYTQHTSTAVHYVCAHNKCKDRQYTVLLISCFDGPIRIDILHVLQYCSQTDKESREHIKQVLAVPIDDEATNNAEKGYSCNNASGLTRCRILPHRRHPLKNKMMKKEGKAGMYKYTLM